MITARIESVMRSKIAASVVIPCVLCCIGGKALAQVAHFNPDTSVMTTHSITIDHHRVSYQAIAGNLPVYGKGDTMIATVFYTYYRRTHTTYGNKRPLLFCFNGGPGSPSLWLHLGYAGPRVVNLDKEGFPLQPYGIKENDCSILDLADIVYVDPVGTGYSRVIGKSSNNDRRFYDCQVDIDYLAGWIGSFLTRYNRWLSPKYLLGESYGTTRVSGLAGRLQQSGIFLNGVILVSSSGWGLDYNAAINTALRLPFLTKAAWYARRLPEDLLVMDWNGLEKMVQHFSYDTLLPGLMMISQLDSVKKEGLATGISRYTGIPVSLVLEKNLDMDTSDLLVGLQEVRVLPPSKGGRRFDQALTLTQLPGHAAEAWYYGAVAAEYRSLSVDSLMRVVEDWMVTGLIPAIAWGDQLDDVRRKEVMEQIAAFTGIADTVLTGHDLLFFDKAFPKAEVGGKGYSIGGFDGRYRGIYGFPLSYSAFNQAFLPAIHDYFSHDLHYRTDLQYLSGGLGGWSVPTNFNPYRDLHEALAWNPFMQVLFQGGYYDNVCPWFYQRYQFWQLDPGGWLKSRIHFKSYRAGHMMYVVTDERRRACLDLRQFILNSLPGPEQPARY
jgi:carboxypeptidase C (cathepsin A)